MTLIQERTHPKDARTRQPIHPLLRRRWSPRAFTDRVIAPGNTASDVRSSALGVLGG